MQVRKKQQNDETNSTCKVSLSAGQRFGHYILLPFIMVRVAVDSSSSYWVWCVMDI
jgi:hypothetical protein